MIAGIVLAGGRSSRMGRPKALLDAGGESFLERAVRTLKEGGCGEVVVVLDPDDRTLAAQAEGAGSRSAWGGGAGTEQIDSLRSGLRALPRAVDAALVLPVDHPLVEAATVARLIDAFRERGAPIVLPVCEGQRGHPVLFSAAVFDELLKAALPEGARSVVHAHEEVLEEVVVSDPGVLADVNTPDDYEEHLGDGS